MVLRFVFTLVAFWISIQYGITQVDLLIPQGTVTHITSPSIFENAVVEGKLIIDSPLTIEKNFIVKAGATVTHSISNLTGMNLSVGNLLHIEVGASININEKGLKGGANEQGSANGQTIHESTGEIISGAGGGIYAAGGSYGGFGSRGKPSINALPNSPYGFIENPMFPGSGGGGFNSNGVKPGGNGGGLARINADTLLIEGMITANGGSGGRLGGTAVSGGGSGGGLYLDVSTISGNGLIQANGGNGADRGCNLGCKLSGSGGGGRIAIYYSSFNFPTQNIHCEGGEAQVLTAKNHGAAGTIYLKDKVQANGELIIDNKGNLSSAFTTLNTTLNTLHTIRLKNQGKLFHRLSETPNPLVVETSVILSNKAEYKLGAMAELQLLNMTSYDVEITGESRLVFLEEAVFKGDKILVENSTIDTEVDLTFQQAEDFLFTQNSTLNILKMAKFTIPIFNANNFRAGSVLLSIESTLNVLSDQITIGAGLTLVKDGSFGIDNSIGNLLIEAFGVLTHSQASLAGLVFAVRNTLEIKKDGTINLNAKGLSGGANGHGDARGHTIDELTGAIVAGAGGGIYASGGSYGGLGSRGTPEINSLPNSSYGLIENPMFPGSGGGGFNSNGEKPGGNGGGLARITATFLILNGVISADGDSGGRLGGTAVSGGGSGGGLYLDVNTLSGNGMVQANGGNGVDRSCNQGCKLSGSGGGGRIAIYYFSLNFPIQNIHCKGGEAKILDATNHAAAGTIYINSKSERAGRLIVDAESLVSKTVTPFKGSSEFIDYLFVQNQGALEFPENFEIDNWEINLQNGKILCPDTLVLHETSELLGNGQIDGHFINNGFINPGDSLEYGKLEFSNILIQGANGQLYIDASGYDRGNDQDFISCRDTFFLGGTLKVELSEDFIFSNTVWMDIISAEEVKDSFQNIIGWETFGISYAPQLVSLIADLDYSDNSQADSILLLSPSGNTEFHVTIIDKEGQPVEGANNIWLDFSDAQTLNPCDLELDWPIVRATTTSDSLGRIIFSPKVGGTYDGKVKVMSSHGLVSEVSIKSLDLDGSLFVSANDFTGHNNNDYNFDGRIDFSDWQYFNRFLGERCIDDISSYLQFELFTNPGPSNIFAGDTIQVCLAFRNLLPDSLIINNLTLLSAGFGIGIGFVPFEVLNGVLLGPNESKNVCVDFVVPPAGHGCFQVRLEPDYYTDQDVLDERGNSEKGPNDDCQRCRIKGFQYMKPRAGKCPSNKPYGPFITIDIKIELDDCGLSSNCNDFNMTEKVVVTEGPFVGQEVITGSVIQPSITDDLFLCGAYPTTFPAGISKTVFKQDLIYCGKTITTNYHIFEITRNADKLSTKYRFKKGKVAPPPPCRPIARQLNINSRKKTTKSKQKNNDKFETSSFLVPVGDQFGTPLDLVVLPFLPEDWTYDISHPNSISTPDTIEVEITHPVIFSCRDTGRVLIYAYTSQGNYVGYAEVVVFDESLKGDVDNDSLVQDEDRDHLQDYLLKRIDTLLVPNAADLNGDLCTNSSDLILLADHLSGRVPTLDCRDAVLLDSSAIYAGKVYRSDTTSILVNTPLPVRGVEFVIRSSNHSNNLEQSVTNGMDLAFNQSDSLIYLHLVDLQGDSPLDSGTHSIIRIPGNITLLSAFGTDTSYQSWEIQFIDSLPERIILQEDQDFNICEGDSLTISASEGFVKYSWSTGDTTEHIKVYLPGTYIVSITTETGFTLVDSVQVTLNSLPSPAIYQDGNRLYTDSAVAYQWYFNGIPVPEATNRELQADSSGVYQIGTTDNQGCFGLSAPLDVIVTTTQESAYIFTGRLWPNPTSEGVNLEIKSDKIANKEFVVKVLDLFGRTLIEERFHTNSERLRKSFNLHNFPTGVYLIVVQMNGKLKSWRIIKETMN